MIVRITFVGVVQNEAGHKKGFKDYVDIHVGSVAHAKKMWKQWLEKNSGIRGASEVFHPLNGYGEIQTKSVEQRPEDDE